MKEWEGRNGLGWREGRKDQEKWKEEKSEMFTKKRREGKFRGRKG